MPKLKIAFMGQAAFGEAVLKALAGGGYPILAAFCPPDKEGRPIDPVKAAATGLNIPVYQFKRMRDDAAIDAFRSLNADLGVMAFVTDIVPREVIDAPAHGTINFHPSLLPRHRGPSSINWPIIQGETRTGLTIFWPDAGLDTGPILLQKEVEIGPEDTLGKLYFDKIFPLGVEAMIEAVSLVESGKAPRIEQDESLATYETWCKPEDVIIDWSQPLDTIYNMVRGSDPSPGSGSRLNGHDLRFYGASKHAADTTAPAGEIIGVDEKGIRIATNGGILSVERVQADGGKKVAAKEWMDSLGIRPGARFGS